MRIKDLMKQILRDLIDYSLKHDVKFPQRRLLVSESHGGRLWYQMLRT
jgi:hypothetical protein